MSVLVLNASYEPINVCSVKRAVALLLKEKAEIIEEGEGELRSEWQSLTRPAVIRLLLYVRLPRGFHRRVTRSAILARDRWECQYCGSPNKLTIDHVIPRSQGGKHEWTNVVTACVPCNQRKGHYRPNEVGMKLRHKPRIPSNDVFVYIAVKVPPLSWQGYLATSLT